MSEAAVISRRINDTAMPAQGSVLIIDDEAEIRESLQTLLEIEGYEVETAHFFYSSFRPKIGGLEMLCTHAARLVDQLS